MFSLLIVIGDVHNSLAFRQLSQKLCLFPHLEYVKCCLDLYSFEHYLVFWLYNFFQLVAGEFLVLGSMFLLWVLLPDEVHLAKASCSNPPCVGDIIDLVHISEWLDAEMASSYHSIGSHRRFLQNGVIESKPSAIPKSPKLLHIFHLYEYFPWWHDDDDFTIHLMKNRSNDSDWSEMWKQPNKQ